MGMVAESIVRLRFSTASLAGDLERDVAKIARGVGEKAGVEMSAGMKAAMLGSLAVTAGVAAAFVASTKAAGDFEAKMVKLTSTAGETGTMVRGNLKLVAAGILEMATSTGSSTKQLADGMYLVESAGFHAQSGLTVLRAAAQGARAEQADLAVVTNAVTSALKSYNLGSDSAVMITNEMIAAVGHGKTTFQEFSGSLATVLPLASAAHIKFSEVAGAIATMTNHGTSAAEATQQLAFTIRALQAPNVQAVKEMDRLGVSSLDVAQHLGDRGLTGTLKLLTEAVASKMGPQGLVMIDTLNKSATAAKDANIMLNAMPTSLKKLATEFLNGSVTIDQWHQGIKGLPADQAAMVKQFATLVSHTSGFNDLLKKGGPASQTMADALKKMTGGANGLNTTLMLTGGNLVSFEGNVAAVEDASKHAGANIEGWGAIQQTFNFKMSAFKGTLEAAKIALGQGLLPVVGAMVIAVGSVIGPMATWMSTHQSLSAVILASVGGFAALILVVRGLMSVYTFIRGATLLWAAAQAILSASVTVFQVMMSRTLIMVVAYETWGKLVSVATKVWAAAQWVLNAALDANPIGALIVIVVALAAAIYLAWTHSSTFRKGLIDAWHGIQEAVRVAWNDVIKPVIQMLVWYWQNILGPVVMWLWKQVFQPAWQSIQIIISIAWAIIQVIFGLMQIEMKIIGAIAMWLWRSVISPVWQGIRTDIAGAWAIIKVIYEGISSFVRNVLAPTFTWLWHAVIQPVWNGIKDTISGVWNNGIKPLFEIFAHFINDQVAPVFRAGVEALGAAWDLLKEKAKAPIKFVVDTVLNHGLLAAYNTVAKAFGVKPDNVQVPMPAGFATGGQIPGTPSAKDNTLIWAATGEHIMPTERTRRWLPVLESIRMHDRLPEYPGDPSGWGIGGYADGGIVGMLSNIGSSLWNLFTDPAKLITGPINALLNGIPGGPLIRNTASGAMHKLLDGLINWIKGGVGGDAGPAGAFLKAQVGKPYIWNSAGPQGYDCSGIVSAVWNILHGKAPYNHTFSTMNEAPFFPLPGPGGVLSAGWTNPGERGPGGNSVGHTAGVLAGLPFESTGGGVGVRIGPGVTPISAFAHIGHFARGGRVMSMDTGYGVLAPGRNTVFNGTGRPEAIAAVGPGGGGFHGTVVIQIGNEEFQGYVDTRIQHDKDTLTQAFGAGRRRQ